MQVTPVTPYLATSELEVRATLKRYSDEVKPILAPPIPVEGIADFLLEFNLSWVHVRDTDEEPVLAYIDAPNHALVLNERLSYLPWQ